MTKIKCTIQNGVNINANLQNGVRGYSAYEVWLKMGNTGTEQDFIDSLKADGGANYNNLINRPSIEMVELVGDKSFEELGVTNIKDNEISNLL